MRGSGQRRWGNGLRRVERSGSEAISGLRKSVGPKSLPTKQGFEGGGLDRAAD